MARDPVDNTHLFNGTGFFVKQMPLNNTRFKLHTSYIASAESFYLSIVAFTSNMNLSYRVG
jgi:hypothetical protein